MPSCEPADGRVRERVVVATESRSRRRAEILTSPDASTRINTAICVRLSVGQSDTISSGEGRARVTTARSSSSSVDREAEDRMRPLYKTVGTRQGSGPALGEADCDDKAAGVPAR